MAREIGSDGLDIMKERTPETEPDVPCWHACVGDGWRPVLLGETTSANDEVLGAGGWVPTNGAGGCVYSKLMHPRRRRKRLLFAVGVIADHLPTNDYCKLVSKTIASPGDCLQVQPDGTLKLVDNHGDD